MIKLIIFLAAAILAILWVMGGRELIGEQLIRLFPKAPMHKGDKVDVFLNGRYNRTATITGISADRLVIYGTVGLPVDYRGRFYAVGTDTNDGSRVVFVSRRKHFKFVKASELVRRMFNVVDDEDMLSAEEEEQEEEAES